MKTATKASIQKYCQFAKAWTETKLEKIQKGHVGDR